MQLFYLSCACSAQKYAQLFNEIECKPGQQVQKYHRLFARGFALNQCDVDMISALPLTRNNYDKRFYKTNQEELNGLKYDYLSILNFPILKHIGIVWQTVSTIIKKRKKESFIICDVLNQSVALGGVIASRILHCPCVGIVTDLPEMLSGNSIGVKINNYIIARCSSYIFLTEKMNDKINKKNKPYIVLEGHIDCEHNFVKKTHKYQNFVCMYAGALSKKYGLDNLVRGFIDANLPDSELHLYGDGDYVPELLEICSRVSNVKYFGTKLNDYVVCEEQRASLLINPRPTEEEFTQYSFPSKNMEYMLTGTPVLTTKLPGMPEEYYPYVYLLEDESENGIATKLKELYLLGQAELQAKGKRAFQFVLENKSNKMQAWKVIDELLQKQGENV